MTARVFKLALMASAVFAVGILLLGLIMRFAAPRDFRLSLTPSLHIAASNARGSGGLGRVEIFNDASGQYRGSIIGLVGADGKIYPPLDCEIAWGDAWGVYYRYFRGQDWAYSGPCRQAFGIRCWRLRRFLSRGFCDAGAERARHNRRQHTVQRRRARLRSAHVWPQRLEQLVRASLSTAGWQKSRMRSNDAKPAGFVGSIAIIMPRSMPLRSKSESTSRQQPLAIGFRHAPPATSRLGADRRSKRDSQISR